MDTYSKDERANTTLCKIRGQPIKKLTKIQDRKCEGLHVVTADIQQQQFTLEKKTINLKSRRQHKVDVSVLRYQHNKF